MINTITDTSKYEPKIILKKPSVHSGRRSGIGLISALVVWPKTAKKSRSKATNGVIVPLLFVCFGLCFSCSGEWRRWRKIAHESIGKEDKILESEILKVQKNETDYEQIQLCVLWCDDKYIDRRDEARRGGLRQDRIRRFISYGTTTFSRTLSGYNYNDDTVAKHAFDTHTNENLLILFYYRLRRFTKKANKHNGMAKVPC